MEPADARRGRRWLTQGLDEASMGKASRTKVDASRREKIAAQRAAERRAERRRRILIASGSILAVIAVVVAFIVIKANNKPSSGNSPNGPTGAALSSVVSKVTSVPASTLDRIGAGSFTGKIQAVSGTTPLTANGKPEMLYMGAEYCPYCAAERWAMVMALSRFGTFSGLSTVHSSTTDTPSNISTFTFHGSSYASKYLTFTPVEMQTNTLDPATGSYPVLDKPTAAQDALITKYDAPPYVDAAHKGAIPFIYFGGKYVSIGASYDATVLSGKSWAQIASALSNPDSNIAKAIGGTANYITAAICKMTGNQPASACTSTVQSLENKL
jgi:hypothetical protein